jgi:hypothetical protein
MNCTVLLWLIPHPIAICLTYGSMECNKDAWWCTYVHGNIALITLLKAAIMENNIKTCMVNVLLHSSCPLLSWGKLF